MTTKHKIPQPKGKTQIPQPDLRLTITRTAKQTAKGARAQQKQPQKICQGHSFFSLQRLHGFRQVVQHVQLHVANWAARVN